jgi:hypothetical protein
MNRYSVLVRKLEEFEDNVMAENAQSAVEIAIRNHSAGFNGVVKATCEESGVRCGSISPQGSSVSSLEDC